MIRIAWVVITLLVCCALSSCETLKGIQENEGLNKIGSFRLNPIQPDSYWYDGTSYEYNEYKIEVTSEPVKAKIIWSDKAIGTTPFTYRFSGVVDRDERIIVHAIPMDENMPAQEAVLRVRTELPRKIHFKLDKK